jgi:hypothetical protein
MTRNALSLMQVAADAEERLLPQARETIINRVLGSHEFEGSDQARGDAAMELHYYWPEFREQLRERLRNWFIDNIAGAISRTPDMARLETRSDMILAIETSPARGHSWMGRYGFMARVGSIFGNWRVVQIVGEGYADLWVEHIKYPGLYYHLDSQAFQSMDPLVRTVFGQVSRDAAFAGILGPLLMKGFGLTIGLSARLSYVLAGIVLDELGEEGIRYVEGQPGRSPLEILKSALGSLAFDRFANSLGKLAAVGAKADSAAAAELIEDLKHWRAGKGIPETAVHGAKVGAGGAGEALAKVPIGKTTQQIKVTPGGWIVHCVNPCTQIMERYALELSRDSILLEKLNKLHKEALAAAAAKDVAKSEKIAKEVAAIAGRLEQGREIAARAMRSVPRGAARVEVGAADVANIRYDRGIPADLHTVAAGRTDVPGLEGQLFEGGSPNVQAAAGYHWPETTPTIVSPHTNPQWVDHAEQGIANQFVDAVEGLHLSKSELEGRTLAIHVSEPSGVCSHCMAGVGETLAPPGPLMQLSTRYPELTIRITYHDPDGVLRYLIIANRLVVFRG